MPHARHPELDLLRTLAILGMIVYHLFYDLVNFYGWNIPIASGGYWFFARATAITFLMVSGMSFAVSWNRSGGAYGKYVRRGLWVLGWGIVVSLITYIVDPETYVRFGILHLIGTGMIVLPLFARLREWTIIPGMAIMSAGLFVGAMQGASMLIPVGIRPAHFTTVDYFPLLPWFGVMLVGYAIGYFFYVRNAKWHQQLSIFHYPLSIITWPGRHSLMIYLMHQPVLMGVLRLVLGNPIE